MIWFNFTKLSFRIEPLLFKHNKNYFLFSTISLKGVKLPWGPKLTPEKLKTQANQLILKIKTAYNEIDIEPANDISCENFLKVMADIDRDFYTEFYYCKFMQYVSPDKELRDVSNEVDKKLNEFSFEIDLRKDLFEKLLILESKNLKLPDESSRYLWKLLRRRKRMGLHLSQEIQGEIKILNDRINDLRTQFNKNLFGDLTYVEFTDKELFGLDSDFINNLDINPDTQKRKVTMKHPEFGPVMQKTINPETRKKLHFAYNSRLKENVPIVEELGTLRHKLAKLLGFDTFSDYNADLFMEKSASNIEKFLIDLSKKLLPLWEQEKKFMLELKEIECKNGNVPFDGKLNSWDTSYYLRKSKEIQYAVDHDKIKEHFPLPFLTNAIFTIYQKLFNLTFQKIENTDIWHPDVETYSIMDNETLQLLGYVYMDLFPREGKFPHYRIQKMQPGCLDADGTRQLGVVALLANFPRPTSEKPALLTHTEAEVFFHEFGHVMHYICNKANYYEFSGTKVQRDFLEAPSQMFENWCWVPEILKMTSSHYIKGDPLPDEMISALIKSKVANVGHFLLRQIALSLIDQKIHTTEKLDTAKTSSDIIQELMGLETMEGTNLCVHFFHTADEYAASYFCYLWSEVFSVDMFETRFGSKGILDPELGKKYRKKILEPGATKDGLELLKDFLGREPNQNAFLRSKGLPVDAN